MHTLGGVKGLRNLVQRHFDRAAFASGDIWVKRHLKAL